MSNVSVIVACSTSVFATATIDAIAKAVPPGLPTAPTCYAEPDQSWRAGYLYRVNKDGDAVYISPNGQFFRNRRRQKTTCWNFSVSN